MSRATAEAGAGMGSEFEDVGDNYRQVHTMLLDLGALFGAWKSTVIELGTLEKGYGMSLQVR